MRIKDSVDLKELEKFGYRYPNSTWFFEKGSMFKNIYENRKNWLIQITPTKIIIERHYKNYSIKEVKNKKLRKYLIQDLIAANLVEE